jgi:hypothetical protein
MARITIDKKIVKYAVAKDDEPQKAAPEPKQEPGSNVVRMHEKLERPEVLIGSTYKVKTPVSDHAMYVTINDIVLNEGTPHEQRRPFEIFINSKNLDHYQWIVALTRIMSAVFRKGGDVTFLVDELKAVFDPRGGYWQQVHAVYHRGARAHRRKASDRDRAPERAGSQQRAERVSGEEAGRVRGAGQAEGRVREERVSGRRAALRQVQHGRGRDARRLHDVLELRLLEVWLKPPACACPAAGTTGSAGP